MEQSLLQELKKGLADKKDQLIKQLEGIGKKGEGEEAGYDATFPEYGESMEDNAIEVADYTTNLSLEKRLEDELARVDASLVKIEEGKYGVCESCGKDIEPEILAISPESTLCVSCKRAMNNDGDK